MTVAARTPYAEWIEQVRKFLASGRSVDQLKAKLQYWLEGYGLLSLSRAPGTDEGTSFILETLKDHPELTETVAKICAELINDYLGGKLQSKEDQNRLLHNLFYMVGALAKPEILHEPVAKVIEVKALPSADSNYLGVPLYAALRAAFVGNQPDRRYLQMWRSWLEGAKDSFLHPSPMDGFEGMLHMPGKLDEDQIGFALGKMAVYLADCGSSRKMQFSFLLGMVQRRFPKHQWSFRNLGRKHKWPLWTIRCKIVSD